MNFNGLLWGLMLGTGAAAAVPLTVGPHRHLQMNTLQGGVLELTLEAGDPHLWTGVVPRTFDAERHHMLALEYFSPSGLAAMTLRFRTAEGAIIVAGSQPVPLAETWQPLSFDLTQAREKPGAGRPDMRFHLALDGKPGAQMQIRNLHLRERSAEEKQSAAEREHILQTREHDADEILAYLRADYPAQIETVHVGLHEITIKGSARERLWLVGIPPEVASHQTSLVGAAVAEIVPNEAGRFSLSLPRIDEATHRDRAVWRWRLRDAQSRWASSAKWPTAVGPALGGKLPRLKATHPKGLGGVPVLDAGPHEIFDLGIHHATLNLVIDSLLRDTLAPGYEPWSCDGQTYYYHAAGVRRHDATVQRLNAAHVIISGILLVGNQRDAAGLPKSLMTHPDAEARGIYTMPNLTTEKGARLYAAALRFLAERYSGAEGKPGRISQWILHNEIDQAGTWTNMGAQPLARYLESYQRSARLMHHTAQLFDRQARVFVSLTHHWTRQSSGTGTYVVRDMLDLFAEMARREGDYEWGVAYHPYPQDLRNPDAWKDEDAKTHFDTPYITPKNIEVLPAYLAQERLLYQGKARGILLSEQGFNTPTLSLEDQRRQLAGIVYMFRKLTHLPTIEAYHLHRYQDMPLGEGGLRLGLITETGEHKLGWDAYAALGTEREAEFDPIADAIMGKEAAESTDFVYLDNGQLRLGVKHSSGAGIAYLALSDGGENVINHWDRGRLVQQSYYGASDGSLWDKQPWRWNPVQGGDWQGSPARVLEFQAGRDTLYARTVGKHWATGADMPEVIFEQRIALKGKRVHVQYRMIYTGSVSHPEMDHELPAVFVEPQYDHLLVYEGPKPWTGDALSRTKPGWPNEARRFTEHWAAFVNEQDFGLGVLVPQADRLTCYRFGDGKREHGSCSYLAPLKRFAITPGMTFEYEVWLTLGTATEIREGFQQVLGATRAKP